MCDNSCGCQAECSGEHCSDGTWYMMVGVQAVEYNAGKVLATCCDSVGNYEVIQAAMYWYYGPFYGVSSDQKLYGTGQPALPSGTVIINTFSASDCCFDYATVSNLFGEETANFFGVTPFSAGSDAVTCNSKYPKDPY